ncbi:Methyl-accepting chemotaxis protein (MCP) signaling domain protein [compost metagenome]
MSSPFRGNPCGEQRGNVDLYLSWKQKFHLLIAVTLLGLVLMTASSFWASRQLSNSQRERDDAMAYAGASLSLLDHWLKLSIKRRMVTPENDPEFQAQLTALQRLSDQYVVQAQGLGQESISLQAQRIDQLIQAEIALQEKWLNLSRQLGLSPFHGQRAVLAASAVELEHISLGLIREFIAAALSSQRDFLATSSTAYAERVHAAIAQMQAKIDELDWRESKVGQAVADFSREFATTKALIEQLSDLEKQLAGLGQQIEQQIDQQNLMLQQGILTSTARQAKQASKAANWVMGLTCVGVSLFMLIALSQASRTLMAQLRNVIQLLSQVAAGNLTVRLRLSRNRKDEFNQLGNASNQMTLGIVGVIRQVVDGNEQLTQLHAYLRDVMERLGDNSTQVEMQTEQTASASQQISATILEIARRTSDVGDAMQIAYDSARTGAAVIVASVNSMRELSQLIQATSAQVGLLTQSSGKVTGIIDVINGLAGQTNLLALNAAIEAARAGAAGRGFSVVADEVRSLAQKTVLATTDIAQIVEDLRRQTDRMGKLMLSGLVLATEGERHAGEAGQAINGITESMEQLTFEMSQVVVAIEEVSATTEDIALKMENINRHTGETKSLRLAMEEHACGLSSQVEALHEIAGRFKI